MPHLLRSPYAGRSSSPSGRPTRCSSGEAEAEGDYIEALRLAGEVARLDPGHDFARLLAQRTLVEVSTTEARMQMMFVRCVGREADSTELATLGRTLRHFVLRYERAPDDAAALLATGEAPLPDEYVAAELAAWMMVASTVLNLDETIVRG